MNQIQRFTVRNIVICIVTVVASVWSIPTAPANPNIGKPDAYLEIHGTVAESVSLGAECIQTYESFRELVDAIEKNLDPKKFSAAYVALQKFSRLNSRLRIFGEPLSVDLQLRIADPEARFIAIRTRYVPTKECNDIAQKIIVELRKRAAVRVKLVTQIRELVNDKNWLGAEALWDKTMNSLWQQLAFLDGQVVSEFALDFYTLDQEIIPVRTSERSLVFQKAVEEKFQVHQQLRDSFLSSLRLATGQLASTGKIAFDGKQLSGSASVKRFVIDFGPRHADLMSDASLDFLVRSSLTSGSSAGDGGPNALATWTTRAQSATKELQEAIIAVIRTDAESGAAMAEGDYVDHLKSVAFSLNRFASTVSPRDFNPALDSVAKKAGLDKRVQAYREATNDVLHWRARIAKQMAEEQRTTGFPEIDIFTRGNLWKNEAGQPLMPVTLTDMPVPILSQPVPKSIQAGWANVQGKTVSVGEIVRFDSDKELFMSRLKNGTYARPFGSTRSPESLTNLKRELLVDDLHPALDLTAAHAIYEAESGEVVDAGGEILSLGLESATTRMLKLPPIAGNFLRYPSIQNSAFPHSEIAAVCVRYDLKLKWIATHYQFVRLP